MKKIVSMSVILLGTVFLAGCGQLTVNQTQPIKPAVEAQKVGQQKKDVSVPVNNSNDALKIYQNDKFGFSLNYPGNYRINETDWENEPQPGGSVYLVQLGDESVVDFDADYNKGILIYVAKIEKDLANGADSLAAPNGMDPISTKEIVLDGQKARNYNDGEVYTVAKNGYEYLLVLGEQANQATKDEFAKVVASFKFNQQKDNTLLLNNDKLQVESQDEITIKRLCKKKVDKYMPHSVGFCGNYIMIIPAAEDAGYFILGKDESIIQLCANYGAEQTINKNPEICKQNCSEYLCLDYK